jgi:hypothetical protein
MFLWTWRQDLFLLLMVAVCAMALISDLAPRLQNDLPLLHLDARAWASGFGF